MIHFSYKLLNGLSKYWRLIVYYYKWRKSQNPQELDAKPRSLIARIYTAMIFLVTLKTNQIPMKLMMISNLIMIFLTMMTPSATMAHPSKTIKIRRNLRRKKLSNKIIQKKLGRKILSQERSLRRKYLG